MCVRGSECVTKGMCGWCETLCVAGGGRDVEFKEWRGDGSRVGVSLPTDAERDGAVRGEERRSDEGFKLQRQKADRNIFKGRDRKNVWELNRLWCFSRRPVTKAEYCQKHDKILKILCRFRKCAVYTRL